MTSSAPSRSSTVRTIYARLRQAGWSHVQVCGILGNIAQESGFRTTVLGFDGTGSYGLCQWLGPRKRALFQFTRDRGRDASAVATQVDFLLHELGTSEQTAARRLRDCATPTAAALAFSKYFERPHPKFAHNDRRIRNAERYARVLADAS
jgi:hypothetical protein